MPGLHGFAGQQIDRQTGIEQAALAEFPFGKGELQGVGNQVGKDRILVEHAIDAVGLSAFEIVAPPLVGLEPWLQGSALPVQLFGGQDIGKDHIALFLILVPGICQAAAMQPGAEVGLRCVNPALDVHGSAP